MQDRMGRQLSTSQVLNKSLSRLKWVWLDFYLYLLNSLAYEMPIHFIRNIFLRLGGMKIGKNSYIHMWTRVYNPKGIEIGEGTIIGDHAFLDGRAPLIIGNNVDIASQVLIYNSEHDVHSDYFDPVEEPVEIGDYAFIGPRSTILPGVKIGRGAIIAAGAVVTEDVKDFEIVGGVPAKKIGERRNKNPHYKLGRARLFQ